MRGSTWNDHALGRRRPNIEVDRNGARRGAGRGEPRLTPAQVWRPAATGAPAIAAKTLSGRVKARYSLAKSGGRISTIVSFSTQTSMTWKGPRLHRKHSHPARCAICS